MGRIAFFLIIALALTWPSSAQDPAVQARVIRCYDGDTCTVDRDILSGRDRVRLRNADTAEIEAHCVAEKRLALAAKQFTTSPLVGHVVTLLGGTIVEPSISSTLILDHCGTSGAPIPLLNKADTSASGAGACNPLPPRESRAHTENTTMTKTLIHGASALVAVLMLAGAAYAAGMLTAKNGMTLYVYDKDTGGASSCNDDCAKHWPPYMAKQGDSTVKNWTVIKRNDGSLQWAYDGKPVYFYADDKKSGDKSGDGKGGVWHIVTE